MDKHSQLVSTCHQMLNINLTDHGTPPNSPDYPVSILPRSLTRKSYSYPNEKGEHLIPGIGQTFKSVAYNERDMEAKKAHLTDSDNKRITISKLPTE